MYPMDAASSPSKWTWGLRIVTLALFDLLNAETVDPIIELIWAGLGKTDVMVYSFTLECDKEFIKVLTIVEVKPMKFYPLHKIS